MATINVNYTCKYQLRFANNYWFTTCGLCYNTKRGKLINQVNNSSCIGYNINGKFYSLTFLHTQLELIPKQKTPF